MVNLDWVMIASIIGGVVCLAIVGVALKARGWREGTVRWLIAYAAAMCVMEAAWALTHLESGIAAGAAWVATTGRVALAFLFLHLSRSFLRCEGQGWGEWMAGGVWLILLLVLESNPFALPDILWLGGPLVAARRTLTQGILLAGWGLFAGWTVLLTMRAYRRSRQPLHRNRLTYWSLALMGTIGAAGLLFAGREERARELASGGLYVLSLLVVTYSVLTYHLPDIRRALRQTAGYSLLILLIAAVYTGGLLAAMGLLRLQPTYPPLQVSLILALALSALLFPLLRLTQRWVEQWIAGAARDPAPLLREYSAQISNILDLERLAETAVGLIGKAMGIRRGALFVIHRETAEAGDIFRLRGIPGMGEINPRLFELPASSPIVAYLQQERAPLAQYDVDLHPRFRSLPQAERDWLASLDMDIYIPIYAQGEWIGLLALGTKRSGDRYFDDELMSLGMLADQTAVALENARLFDDLKAQHEEIARLNRDLAVLNKELAIIGQAKSDFIDIASHELRTPLTQVRGYTDILNEMIEEGTLTRNGGRKLIGGLKIAAERLEEIIDTMFDVAQLDTETMELNLVRGSVAAIIKSATDEWAAALAERRITLSVADLAELPPIMADHKRLQQAFSQLVQNAIKFTPDGGSIRITGKMLEWRLPAEQAIEIVVADSGIGIAPEELEHIFEKFYRVGNVLLHSTGKTKFKGAGPGLGLTIAQGIVKAHGGRIWAESQGYDEDLCPGSQFHVVLPVHGRRSEASKTPGAN